MVEAFEDSGPAELICSAKGCRAPAAYQLRWNNPKLHAPSARKTWLACTAHRESLGHFLDSRRFLREVLPIGTAGAPNGAGAADAATT
jgi:hypothetical protein